MPQDAVAGQGARYPKSVQNQIQDLSPVADNVFASTLQDIIGFYIQQVQLIAEDGYDDRDTMLYWKLSDIRECCELKSNIPVIHVELLLGDTNIKCLQALSCWAKDLTFRGKDIDLNHFNGNIMSEATDKSGLDYKYTTYGRVELDNPKKLFNKNGTIGNI